MALELKFIVNDKATPEIKKLQSQLQQLRPQIKDTEQGFLGLNKSVVKLAAGYVSLNIASDVTKSFIKQADTMTNVESKLRLVTKSTEELKKVQDELFKSSQQTRTSLAANAELYQRMGMATRELNLSQKEMLELTKSINQAMIVSGTSAEGVTALVTQLGQAFSSDFKAVAQELGTIRDQAPRLYQAMLDGTEKTADEFKKMAEQGELSSEMIIKALKKQGIAIDKDFKKMGVTVEQSMQQMSNSTLVFVDKLDEMTGISESVSSTFTELSKSISSLSEEDIKAYVELSKQIAILGGSLVATKVAFKAFQSAQVAYKGVMASLVETTTSYNIATGKSVTTTKALSAAQKAGAMSAKALSAAMKAIPAVAVGSAIYTLTEYLFDAKEASEELEQSLSKTGKTLSELSKSSLEYRKIIIDKEYGKLLQEIADLKEDVSEQTFFESDEEHAREKKELEELIEKYNKIFEIYKNINKELENRKNIKIAPEIKISEEDNNFNKEWGKFLIEDAKKENEIIAQGIEERSALKKQKLEEEAAARKAYNEYMLNLEYQAISDKWDYEEKKAEEAQAEKKKQLENSRKFEADMLSAQSSLLDSQISLIDSTKEWNTELGKSLSSVVELSNGFSKMFKDNATYTKAQLNLDQQHKSLLKEYGKDEAKKAKINKLYEKEKIALQKKALQNELEGYATITGGVKNMFNEKTAAYKAFEAIENGLHVARLAMMMQEVAVKLQSDATTTASHLTSEAAKAEASGVSAIVSSMVGLPFPLNLAAMAATAAAVGTLLSQIGGSVSGGAGGGATFTNPVTAQSEDYSSTTDLVIGRLDRQIELLEQLNQQGTASRVTLTSATTEFERATGQLSLDLKETFIDNLNDVFQKYGYTLDETYTSRVKDIGITDYLQGNNQLIDPDYRYIFDFLYFISKEAQLSLQQNNELQNEFEESLSNFTITVIDSLQQLQDSTQDFKDAYDNITGSMKYATQDLQQAYNIVDSLRGNNSFETYLETQIVNLEKVANLLTPSNTALLLSDSVSDYQAKIALTQELSSITGIVFANGAEDALNFLDSINLVSETMQTSRENIKQWNDSFKTTSELTEEMAQSLGVNVAKSLEELQEVFNQLANDTFGLTDAELDFLEANKEFLDEIDEAVVNFKNTMSGMVKSIDDTIWAIEKSTLQGQDLTNEEIKRLNETQRAFESTLAIGDNEKAKELLNEITSLSRSIAGTSQDNVQALNDNLIEQLNFNKQLIDFEDDVIKVHIVASDIDATSTVSTTPSVYVTNQSSSDDRLATLEAIMIEVLKTNNKVYDILARLENDGIKTIS